MSPTDTFIRGKEVLDTSEYPSNLNRVALRVEYDGAAFHGWQRQTGRSERTVQGELELALSSIADEPIELVCAGRTDARVHGTSQWVHFDTQSPRPTRAWCQGVNTRLPDDVKVSFATEISPLFHARFSAHSRTYRYLIYNANTPPVHLKGKVTWYRHELDITLLQQAADALLGEHDFSSFRGAGCQASSPIRTLEYARWIRQGSYVGLEVRANAFLMHMVRNFVGSMLEVGSKRRSVEWIIEVLHAKDRTKASVTAPPDGLYLVGVGYDSSYGLPSECVGPIGFDPWFE